jgi:hypothetical protein
MNNTANPVGLSHPDIDIPCDHRPRHDDGEPPAPN